MMTAYHIPHSSTTFSKACEILSLEVCAVRIIDMFKYFDNSIREDSILTIAKGGIVYAPGSAGTMQEIFQEAVQNHYLSFGYASPMIFMNRQYWTEEMPVYRLMEHLIEKGKYKNLLTSLTDSTEEIVSTILNFRDQN